MDDFLKGISSLYWWFSVVMVGMLINLASAYLKKPLDKFFSRWSSFWRNRSEKVKQIREIRIIQLVGKKQEQIMEAFAEMRCRLRSALFFILSLCFIIMLNVSPPGTEEIYFFIWIKLLGYILAFSLMIFSLQQLNSAIELKEIVKEAMKRESQDQDSTKKNNMIVK